MMDPKRLKFLQDLLQAHGRPWQGLLKELKSRDSWNIPLPGKPRPDLLLRATKADPADLAKHYVTYTHRMGMIKRPGDVEPIAASWIEAEGHVILCDVPGVVGNGSIKG